MLNSSSSKNMFIFIKIQRMLFKLLNDLFHKFIMKYEINKSLYRFIICFLSN
jgi:hypothetical protein